ncbi:hypothetical protein ITJ55_13860 [Frigoribacterium sp. VKM Ac-1396]|uniref:hypothetical protein n=1 Tax=Frigoribacterium sp. VKM Ac-1396 TaxID=2783821 RepID=UPI00188A492B|nr:hypothetical protein [Frigoribacterium sp. VKM Ac-1396]MBF4601897.1 hypothetical protein [Frigoribacterium sp. VKM Ac-1396]
MNENEEPTWEEVFHSLDAATLTPEERLNFLNRRLAIVVGARDWGSLLTGGEEAMLTWQAAVDAFAQGNWVATLLCCQATCERTIAGLIAVTELGHENRQWERMGMGRLLDYAVEKALIPDSLSAELRLVCDRRKPYGHWKPVTDPSTPTMRVQAQMMEVPVSYEDLWRGLLVQDATHAIATTLDLYYGHYGFSA